MKRQTLFLTMEKETKNTVRYQEESPTQPPVVGTLYVQRWALGQPFPLRRVVTIDVAEELTPKEKLERAIFDETTRE